MYVCENFKTTCLVAIAFVAGMLVSNLDYEIMMDKVQPGLVEQKGNVSEAHFAESPKMRLVDVDVDMKSSSHVIIDKLANNKLDHPAVAMVEELEELEQIETEAKPTPEPQPQKPSSSSSSSSSSSGSTTKTTTKATRASPSPLLPPLDPHKFDPTITIPDYLQYPPQAPTIEWVTHCAETISLDHDIVKPWKVGIPGYRLGDCTRRCVGCEAGLEQGRPNANRMERKRIKNINVTMAGRYWKAACAREEHDPARKYNYDVLQQVLEDFGPAHNFTKPDRDAVVIHLRLGDVVEKTKQTVAQLLIKGGKGVHIGNKRAKHNSIRSLFEYWDVINSVNATKVAIVGGSHFADQYKKSRAYQECLARGLARGGKQVTVIDDGDADRDFYYMCFSGYFVTSTGGFSEMIARMTKRNGGQVIGAEIGFF